MSTYYYYSRGLAEETAQSKTQGYELKVIKDTCQAMLSYITQIRN
jgi:hypothetical protein